MTIKSDLVNQCPEGRIDAGFILCPNMYVPVCTIGFDNSKQDYSNSCFACLDTKIAIWTGGKCNQSENTIYNNIHVCPQKRKNICNKMYIQTCGYYKNSVDCEGKQCRNKYSNPCMACADPNVLYTIQGDCDVIDQSQDQE